MKLFSLLLVACLWASLAGVVWLCVTRPDFFWGVSTLIAFGIAWLMGSSAEDADRQESQRLNTTPLRQVVTYREGKNFVWLAARNVVRASVRSIVFDSAKWICIFLGLYSFLTLTGSNRAMWLWVYLTTVPFAIFAEVVRHNLIIFRIVAIWTRSKPKNAVHTGLRTTAN